MERDEICARFIEALPYDPYPFQEEAILRWFEAEGGLLVSAPTGMGKTLIAEAAVFEALASGTRLYYTTPLIALTDQKFRELQDRAEAWGFARDDVGLVTGNRKINPDAPVRVVVAEILLNHLLSHDHRFDDVGAVVMDEFHWFNEPERGIVWELSLVLLPAATRVLLLSATVGNAIEFCGWLREKHGRKLELVRTDERRVPLEYQWVEDKLLTEHLVEMISDDDALNRTPALVFCFSRDECWEVAERLKGLPLTAKETRAAIEEALEGHDLGKGIAPKLKQMLLRGVGVHHAGVLPRHKQLVEDLFLKKLTPFIVCTETLAAGINLPARSVVLRTILKGKPREKKLIAPSAAQQMFGRAGRPQFDTRGFVVALAHEDDVKILRWREKYDAIDPKSKDPNILRARKQLERKKPLRRTTEQYWTKGQFETLVKAKPAGLASRTMIPYQFLVYLLSHGETLEEVRAFLGRRFDSAERLASFERSLDHMLANLEVLGVVSRRAGAIVLEESAADLVRFRSVDPLYGLFLARQLPPANFVEKVLALESVLPVPRQVAHACDPPFDLEPGPLEREVLAPRLLAMGVTVAKAPARDDDDAEEEWNPWKEPEARPPTFPEMLRIVFEAQFETPDEIEVQTKWVAGGVFDSQGDFHRFTGARSLQKNEGLVLRHLLRLAVLAGEFLALTGDPDYEAIASMAARAGESVDPEYTEQVLAKAAEEHELLG